MNLTPNLSSGWSFSLISDNILLLTFALLMIGMIFAIFTADNPLSSLLRLGFLLDTLAIIALLSQWEGSAFWTVVLWAGFVLTTLLGIARAIMLAKAR